MVMKDPTNGNEKNMDLIDPANVKFSPNATWFNYGLSAALQVGKSSWVADDETIGLERWLSKRRCLLC
jgi:hypothetical protein